MFYKDALELKRLYYLAITLVVQCIVTQAVLAEDTIHYSKLWNSINISGSITEDKQFLYFLEPNLRFYDRHNKFEQAHSDFAVGNQIFPTLSLWLGTTPAMLKNSQEELYYVLSVWEQISWDMLRTAKFSLSDRSRIEQQLNFSQPKILWRFREKLTFALPLGSREIFSLIVENEIFINMSNPEWASNKLVSENRASVIIRSQLSKQFALDLGYLHQQRFAQTDQQNNIITLNLRIQND
jgi:hypothetical protein